jgi:hypothetical protein
MPTFGFLVEDRWQACVATATIRPEWHFYRFGMS